MFDKYRIKDNESIEDVARKFHTNPRYIEDLNNLSINEFLREGMDIIVPKNKEKYFDTYTINKGDSLYAIAKKFNTTVDSIKKKNNLVSNNLQIGQKLVI